MVVARTRARRSSIEVWDTGIGIPADELPKVFDEFYQVDNPGRDRSRGLGMGLAIVKRLVLLMGHQLEVRSRPGRGTVFRILIKRHRARRDGQPGRGRRHRALAHRLEPHRCC